MNNFFIEKPNMDSDNPNNSRCTCAHWMATHLLASAIAPLSAQELSNRQSSGSLLPGPVKIPQPPFPSQQQLWYR